MSKVAVALSLSALALSACASTQSNASGGDDSSLDANTVATTDGAAEPATAASSSRPAEASAPASGPASGQDDARAFLDQETERLSLKEQEKRAFVDSLLAQAEGLLDRQLYREAYNTLMRAKSYAPDDLEVLNKLEQVAPLVGEGLADPVLDEGVGRVQTRQQYFRAEAEDAIRAGKMAVARNDYGRAIHEFNIALDYVRFAPSGDWGTIRAEAERLLEDAKSTRFEAERQARLAEEQRSAEMLRKEEAEARAREQARLDTLLADAISAFDTQAYEQAMKLAKEVMAEDPRNEKAQEIYDTAFKARREELNEEYLEAKQTEFRKWKAHILSQRIPNSDVLRLPDAGAWRKMSEMRLARTTPGGDETENPTDVALRARLETDQVRGLRIDGAESLMAVARQIQALTDVPIAVSSAAENAVFDEGVIYELELNNPVSIAQALNLVAEQSGPDVTWTVDVGAVLFTTKERARGDMVPLYYPVADLVLPLPNFIAPRIERIRLLEELEDDDGGTPWGTIGEQSIQLEADTLADLLTRFVAVESWDEDGTSSSAYNESGILVVQTMDVHREINQFLEDLRRFTSMMVTVDTKFLTITDAWLQQIGVDWRGIDNPGVPFTDLDDFTNGNDDNASQGFDNGGQGNNPAGSPSSGFYYDDGPDGDFKARSENIFDSSLGELLSSVGGLTTQIQIIDDALLSPLLTAVEKSSDARIVNSQVLTVYNSQQAAVSVINQRAYVQDFDVEVATAAFIADPIINVLSEGVSLQVRPTVHQNRQNMTLEVQPTVARIVRITPFTTTLGNNSAAAITLQLPQLEVQSLRSTTIVPDGGTILIGGLNSIRNVERRAEVPWLGKVPVLGFFFKEEGYSDETTSLMILMKALITDIRDEAGELE